MILSKKTKHGLLSMGLAFGILTSSVVSPASVSVLASDYSARNVLSDAYIQSQFPAPISEENITSASVRSEALQLQSSKRALILICPVSHLMVPAESITPKMPSTWMY